MRRLTVIDDIFPLELSAFRYQEYLSYLQHFPNSRVFTTGSSLDNVNDGRSLDELLHDFSSAYPEYADRVTTFDDKTIDLDQDSDLFYFVFLGNAHRYLPLIEKHRVPFVFTLYPGGGFYAYDKASNKKLRELLGHPLFCKVIVNQIFIKDYLVDGGFCDAAKIEHIQGMVVPDKFFTDAPQITADSKAINICFAAHNYGDGGVSKGYDIFLDVVRSFKRQHKDLADKCKFHVIGGQRAGTRYDYDLRSDLIFYGSLATDDFIKSIDGMHIIVAPNRSGTAGGGSFDGFPSGTAIQAAIRGSAIFSTDNMQENWFMKDGEEIVITNHSPSEIAAKIADYVRFPQKLARLREASRRLHHRLYAPEEQLGRRMQILRQFLQTTLLFLAIILAYPPSVYAETLQGGIAQETTFEDHLSRLKIGSKFDSAILPQPHFNWYQIPLWYAGTWEEKEYVCITGNQRRVIKRHTREKQGQLYDSQGRVWLKAGSPGVIWNKYDDGTRVAAVDFIDDIIIDNPKQFSMRKHGTVIEINRAGKISKITKNRVAITIKDINAPGLKDVCQSQVDIYDPLVSVSDPTEIDISKAHKVQAFVPEEDPDLKADLAQYLERTKAIQAKNQ